MTLVKAYNGKKNIYFSLYNSVQKRDYQFGGDNFSTAVIDKIFFDLDGNSLERPFEDLKKLIGYAWNHNYKFCMCFSGKKGFHFYLFCDETKSKDYLKNAHRYFTKILNIDLDCHVVGDVARISRMPNTYHLTGNKFCIPLSIDDVKKGLPHILKKAESPNPEFCIYGTEIVDLKALPKVENGNGNGEIPEFDYNSILEVDDALINDFPPCVKAWLTTKEHSIHRNRFYFALYCAHAGLTPQECNSLAKKYLGKIKERSGCRTRYQEFISEKAIEYAYSKDFVIPNCARLFDEKACLGKCEYYKKGSFYLYKHLGEVCK